MGNENHENEQKDHHSHAGFFSHLLLKNKTFSHICQLPPPEHRQSMGLGLEAKFRGQASSKGFPGDSLLGKYFALLTRADLGNKACLKT